MSDFSARFPVFWSVFGDTMTKTAQKKDECACDVKENKGNTIEIESKGFSYSMCKRFVFRSALPNATFAELLIHKGLVRKDIISVLRNNPYIMSLDKPKPKPKVEINSNYIDTSGESESRPMQNNSYRGGRSRGFGGRTRFRGFGGRNKYPNSRKDE